MVNTKSRHNNKVTAIAVNRLSLIALLTVFLSVFATSLTSKVFAADTDALYTTVDRSQIYQNETIDLTVIGHLALKLDFSSLFSLRNMELPAPDIGSLEDQFDIIDQQQKYNIRSVNGENNATITWVYTLSPKKAGALEIPIIKHDGKASQPITIKVLEGKGSADDGRAPLVFLEAEVDKTDAYVQEQIIYTLRLYYADNLTSGDLSSPELNDAIVEQVGDQAKYYRMRHNQRYEVIERKFLIFPQKSGILDIAPQTFTGTIIDTRARKRKHVRDNTSQIQVNIAPPAESFTGKTWLPAASLNLSEKWDTPPENISVGDAFTRTVSMQALGLLGSALPPIKFPDIDGFKQYPDQPVSESMEHQAGVQSSRTVSIAMVAIKEGVATLPEIKIPWWDTVNQVERIAIIPSRQLAIGAGSTGNFVPAPQQKIPTTLTSIDQNPQTKDETDLKSDKSKSIPPVNSDANSSNAFLYVIILVLVLGWIATTVVLITRRKPIDNPEDNNIPTEKSLKETTAFKQLSESIQKQSPQMLGELVQWAKLQWPDITINSVADIKNILNDDAFSRLVTRAETRFYASDSTTEWDNDALLKRLIKIRRKNSEHSNTVLPAFYPDK